MLKLIELAGTPYEMGRQHGQQLKDQVRSLSQKRLRLALLRAKTAGATVSEERCRKLAHEHLSCHEQYFPDCLLYTSPSPRDGLLSRMPSSA